MSHSFSSRGLPGGPGLSPTPLYNAAEAVLLLVLTDYNSDKGSW